MDGQYITDRKVVFSTVFYTRPSTQPCDFETQDNLEQKIGVIKAIKKDTEEYQEIERLGIQKEDAEYTLKNLCDTMKQKAEKYLSEKYGIKKADSGCEARRRSPFLGRKKKP